MNAEKRRRRAAARAKAMRLQRWQGVPFHRTRPKVIVEVKTHQSMMEALGIKQVGKR